MFSLSNREWAVINKDITRERYTEKKMEGKERKIT